MSRKASIVMVVEGWKNEKEELRKSYKKHNSLVITHILRLFKIWRKIDKIGF